MKNALSAVVVAGIAGAAMAQTAAITFVPQLEEIVQGDSVVVDVFVDFTGSPPGSGGFFGMRGEISADAGLGDLSDPTLDPIMNGPGSSLTDEGTTLLLNAGVSPIGFTNVPEDQLLFSFTFTAANDYVGFVNFGLGGDPVEAITATLNTGVGFALPDPIDYVEVNVNPANGGQGLLVTPAPGAAALLGLGGLAAARRRR